MKNECQLRPADLKLIEYIIQASHILFKEGHSDMHNGQISARLFNEDAFWIKGATVGFEEVTQANTIRMTYEGQVLYGTNGVPPEWNLHAEIYRTRPDVKCIIHTHPKNSILFGATGLELLPISHDACPFYKRLKVFDYTTNTILDKSTAEKVAHCLENHHALLLRNHGIVAVGKTIKHATVYAILLEKACALQLSLNSFNNLLVSTYEEATQKDQYIFSDSAIASYWDYYVRSLKRGWPTIS